jgi:arylsulfatase A-like enzyme
MAELWETFTHGFQGKIGTTRAESAPWWPEPKRAPAGAPNIVIVYMDDMGYADVGCFGSEIDTPHIDALAARGLRFNHYTTHPICSPVRAALLTGRNAHAVGTGWVANNHAGFPGYRGRSRWTRQRWRRRYAPRATPRSWWASGITRQTT